MLSKEIGCKNELQVHLMKYTYIHIYTYIQTKKKGKKCSCKEKSIK